MGSGFGIASMMRGKRSDGRRPRLERGVPYVLTFVMTSSLPCRAVL